MEIFAILKGVTENFLESAVTEMVDEVSSGLCLLFGSFMHMLIKTSPFVLFFLTEKNPDMPPKGGKKEKKKKKREKLKNVCVDFVATYYNGCVVPGVAFLIIWCILFPNTK